MEFKNKSVCFFSHENKESLKQEQYSIQDIRILSELGFSVKIANSFKEIPWNCDFYFSWWASGSVLPLIKAKLSCKPIIIVAGGNEAKFYRDSIDGQPLGYLATPWYKKLATKLSLRLSTVVLVVSHFMVEDAKKLGARNPIIIHNCINTNSFNLSNDEKKYVTTIFKVDNLVVKIKRGEVFIKSIPYVINVFPEQKFIIIGEKGNAYARLKNLTKTLNIEKHVEFVGNIDNSEVLYWLQNSKAYVQISDTETFGVAIAEAMSCGVPVVVSRRGAIPEIVGKSGVYVDHNNAQSVASGIISILNMDESQHSDFGKNGRQRIIDNFTYEKRKESIHQIVSGILDETDSSKPLGLQ
jgi:glycosyltransferase involved in cell wall biosynthesis